MDDTWDDQMNALLSGDTGAVNDAIESIEQLDLEASARLFPTAIDDIESAYESADDGYVRQSLVRAADQLSPKLGLLKLVDEEELVNRMNGVTIDELESQTDKIRDFLLVTITDADGRVRNASKRALKQVARSYDGIGNQQQIELLVAELDDIATEYEGKREAHIKEAREEVRFFVLSTGGRLLWGLDDIQGEVTGR